MRNAASVSVGQQSSSALHACSPPADAPTAITGKLNLAGRIRSSFASSAAGGCNLASGLVRPAMPAIFSEKRLHKEGKRARYHEVIKDSAIKDSGFLKHKLKLRQGK